MSVCRRHLSCPPQHESSNGTSRACPLQANHEAEILAHVAHANVLKEQERESRIQHVRFREQIASTHQDRHKDALLSLKQAHARELALHRLQHTESLQARRATHPPGSSV